MWFATNSIGALYFWFKFNRISSDSPPVFACIHQLLLLLIKCTFISIFYVLTLNVIQVQFNHWLNKIYIKLFIYVTRCNAYLTTVFLYGRCLTAPFYMVRNAHNLLWFLAASNTFYKNHVFERYKYVSNRLHYIYLIRKTLNIVATLAFHHENADRYYIICLW